MRQGPEGGTVENIRKLRRAEMKTLKDSKVGDSVKVVKLHGQGAVKRRIMDMGL